MSLHNPNPPYRGILTPPVPYRCPVCGGNGLVANGFYRQTSGPTLICAVRGEDAESVLIETIGETIVFDLDDGDRLEFDRVELLSALGQAIAGDMGRLRAA